MFRLLALSLLAVASAQHNTFQNHPNHPQNVPVQRPVLAPRVQEHEQHHDECHHSRGRQGHVPVPREHLLAHHRFTSDLLKHPGFWRNIHHNGVSATNSFTLGHFLAVLSQETFDLPTSSIPTILRVQSPQDAVESYSKQFYNFEEEDNHVYPTSYLFTPHENLPATPGVERLYTRKFITQLWKNPHAPNHINELVRVATRDYVEDELVPQVPPFHEQTAGVFVNSFHFANDWKHEWTKIGKYNFNTQNGPVPIENYEHSGAFPVLETQSYTAVAVPLEGGVKHAVFVLTHNDVKDYFAQGVVDEIFTNGPEAWPTKNVRVQVPHVNYTVAHGFSQLQEHRLECHVEGGAKPHTLQPVVQVVTFSINHEELVYSVANGAQVNQAGQTSRHLNQPNRPFQPQSQFNPNTITNNFSNNQYRNKYSSAELVFDKPFFVYLHDKSQGPFGFNVVSHSFHEGHEAHRQVRHHDSPFDFQEQTKVHRWNCPQ